MFNEILLKRICVVNWDHLVGKKKGTIYFQVGFAFFFLSFSFFFTLHYMYLQASDFEKYQLFTYYYEMNFQWTMVEEGIFLQLKLKFDWLFARVFQVFQISNYYSFSRALHSLDLFHWKQNTTSIIETL